MTSEPGHQHSQHAHSDPPGGGSWADMSAELIADAELLAPVREEALAIVHRLLDGQRVASVLDFGCGPGVTTVALAQSFPAAMVTAVDGSEDLLRLSLDRAAAHGVSDRVTARHADLEAADGAGPGPFEVVWASMVLHHLADLDGVLARLAARLSPGGWLAVTEFGGPLSVLRASDTVVASGAWDRFTAASRRALAHHLPLGEIGDWPARLAGAGLVEVSQRECVLDRPAPLRRAERSWLSHRLGRERQAVADQLSVDDLAVIDRLIDSDSAGGILHRDDLHLRVGRLFLAGRRPLSPTG